MKAFYSSLDTKENKELIFFYNQTAKITVVFICSSKGRQGAI